MYLLRAAGLVALLLALDACGGSAPEVDAAGAASTCGNGIVEPGEACDDGFRDLCGDCNATCTGPGVGHRCGDGFVCPQYEACDDGAHCGACGADCSGHGASACSGADAGASKDAEPALDASAGPAVCGNGVREPGEACDDGDGFDDDFCSNDCQRVDFACTVDHVLSAGHVDVEPFQDFVPLCDGWVIRSDETASRILVTNVVTGQEHGRFDLSLLPSHFAFDRATSSLYIAHGSEDRQITRLHLISGAQDEITVSGEVQRIAVGPAPWVFASIGDQTRFPERPLDIIDADAAALVETQYGTFSNLLAFNLHRSELLSGDEGIVIPPAMSRWRFDAQTHHLLLVQGIRYSGVNAQALVLSDDDQHVLYACGGGNELGYTIEDLSADDLTRRLGVWLNDAYPTGAAITPDGRFMVGANHDGFMIFDGVSYGLLDAVAVPSGSCAHHDVHSSAGGRLAFLASACGISFHPNRLDWQVLPP